MELVSATGFGNEIDAGVSGIESLFRCPIGVEPDIRIEIGVGCLIAQVGADEFLEVGSLLSLGLRCSTVVGEKLRKC